MPTFPRTILPIAVTPPALPAALRSFGETGKQQARTPLLVGRTWEELYPPVLDTDTVTRAWLAQVQQWFRTGTLVTVEHRSYRTANGPGGGTPLVNGASQTGNSINTDGWPNSTTVLKAGDLVKLGTLQLVYELTGDATSNGAGQAALAIEPQIIVGTSPADNGVVAYGASVTFAALITNLDLGQSNFGYIDGLRIAFQEQP